MTTGMISPWPLVRKGDQQHPVKTLQVAWRALVSGMLSF
jgi:hypothetical protein